MRWVVTGGAGFIGSHITESLLKAGDDVCVIDNLSSGRRENLSGCPGATLCVADINESAAIKAINDFKPDGVVHLAAQIDVRHSVANPCADADTNVLGSIRIAQAAAESGAQVFVFSSTGGAIYGEQDSFPADESHARRPVSPYGVSKLCAEHYIDYFGRLHGMRTVFLRYANVYGPRQDPHGEAGVVAIFAGRMLKHESVQINGDGKQTRDYVFVGDVARANLLALRSPEVQGPVNIGTGVETDVITLAQKMVKISGSKSELKPAPGQPGEQRRSVLDNAHAANVLDWRPETSIDEGLAATIEWFRGR